MASRPAPDDRGQRSSRMGGGLRRGRGQTKPAVDLHLLAAAYAIDALDDAQRDAFAAHLPGCPDCQAMLAMAPGPLAALAIAALPRAATPPTLAATLRAVVTDVLPPSSQVEVSWRSAQTVEAAPPPPTPETEPEPAADSATASARDWLETPLPPRREPAARPPATATPAPGGEAVQAPSWDAWAHRGPATSAGAEGDTDADHDAAPRSGVPPAMQGGWSPRGGANPAPRRRTAVMPLITAGALLIVVIALLGWGMIERGDVDAVRAELAAQQTAVAEVRANANASSFTMVPTEDGSAAAAGTTFFALPALRGAVVLRDMPGLPSGQAYQIWFVAPDGTLTPGPTARPDARGTVVMALDAAGLQVERLYVTAAPQEGELTADFDRYPVLMVGILGGATG